MTIPNQLQFFSEHLDKNMLQKVLDLEEQKGLKKTAIFVKIFNLGLKKYMEEKNDRKR